MRNEYKTPDLKLVNVQAENILAASSDLWDAYVEDPWDL